MIYSSLNSMAEYLVLNSQEIGEAIVAPLAYFG